MSIFFTAISPNPAISDNEEKDGKIQVFQYLVPVLAAANVALISLTTWLCLLLKKSRSGVRREAMDASDKTDEVNYAALNFSNKQRRNVQRRTNTDPTVIYGAVRHQEEL
ncbi:hypothetical protein AOLI_G00111490 [Acnodon oligacanthus]